MGVKSVCTTGWKAISSAVLEYDTPKIVHIKNKKIGLLNRIVQLAIIFYIIAYVPPLTAPKQHAYPAIVKALRWSGTCN